MPVAVESRAPCKSRLRSCTTTNALVEGGGGGTAGLHAESVPSSAAKMKRAVPDAAPDVTTKPVALPLNTRPVGCPDTFTSSDCFPPSPSYSVEELVPLFATHQKVGVVAGPAASPHAFFSFASMNLVFSAAVLETRRSTSNTSSSWPGSSPGSSLGSSAAPPPLSSERSFCEFDSAEPPGAHALPMHARRIVSAHL